jgi:hypothetical protein
MMTASQSTQQSTLSLEAFESPISSFFRITFTEVHLRLNGRHDERAQIMCHQPTFMLLPTRVSLNP